MTERSDAPAASGPPPSRTKLVVIGGGNMGAALVGGLLRQGWASPGELAVVEPVAARRQELAERFPGVVVVATVAGPAGSTEAGATAAEATEAEATEAGATEAEPTEAGANDAGDPAGAGATVRAADAAVVAVKPGDVPAACQAAAGLGVRRLLSIAAGVTTAAIEAALGRPCAVVRAMPNTPALVGQAASAIAAGAGAGDDDLAWAESVLSAVGTVVRVPESLLDAVTGLSGSGPAYVFLLAEALVDGGVAAGLPRDTAARLVRQLLVGSAALLASSDTHPAELRAQVTSPGGTTAAGVHALERGGFRAAVVDCVLAATERSRELAG